MKNGDILHAREALSSLEGLYMMLCRTDNGRTLDYEQFKNIGECVFNIRAFIRYLSYIQSNNNKDIQSPLQKYNLLTMLTTVVKLYDNNDLTLLQPTIKAGISDLRAAIESLSVLNTLAMKETSNEK